MQNRHIKIGCSGWYYWHWKHVVYPEELPTSRWFAYYQTVFDTVELNAPFYRWPRSATVRNWLRQAQPRFQYSVKVNQLITHEKRFRNTKTLIRDFCSLADILGEHMGCFLFQMPPSFHYTAPRLRSIVSQLDCRRRNAIEFRHRSWWNEQVFETFREAGVIFCTVSAPRLPDDLIESGDTIYVRFHGAAQWYRYDYSAAELDSWANKLHRSQATEIWAFFNNDFHGCAFRNAQRLREALAGAR